jgi:glycosyltransferase involved in cell wall biosynthesis
MTVLFVGRLVPFKLPEVLLRSFAASPILRQHRLVIVGDGPERPRLDRIVAEEGLSECVEFTGSISQSEVGRLMRESEIFAFPSIREQGGGVLTLAMMSGMTCVAVNYGGPATRVASGCGVKVPLGDVDQLIISYTQELEALVQDPQRVIELGQAGRRFTEGYYAWERKAQKTLEIYHWVLGYQQEKPNFWAPINDAAVVQEPETLTGFVVSQAEKPLATPAPKSV